LPAAGNVPYPDAAFLIHGKEGLAAGQKLNVADVFALHKCSNQPAAWGVPQFDAAVAASRKNKPSVGRPFHRIHRTGMPGLNEDFRLRPVIAGRGRIGRPKHGGHNDQQRDQTHHHHPRLQCCFVRSHRSFHGNSRFSFSSEIRIIRAGHNGEQQKKKHAQTKKKKQVGPKPE